jgi:aspartyl-tRNA(Asn)/glutamyl-tRNA(Gln) amidotransferase subunit B
MEKGQMRVEANISVGKDGKLGTKVEVKNLNSFRSVERAISYEIDRQIVLIDSGGKVVQETRGWDEGAQKTFSQRIKENSNDYRYFPDPDLPKLYISKIEEFSKENIKKEMPELPNEKRDRYFSLGLKSEDVEMLVSDFDLALFFDKTSNGEDSDFIKLCVNYLTSDIAGLLKGTSIKESKITPQGFKELIKMIKDGLVSSRGGKDILAVLFENGGDPNSIAKEKGLIQQNDEGTLKLIVEELIKENPNVVQDFKNGKESALQFFVGQGMKKSKGSANPKVLMDIVKKSLS